VKKVCIVLVMLFCFGVLFAQVTDRSNEIFPDVSIVPPLTHFEGDGAPMVISLYSMQNANHYLDAYKALVLYHNQTMSESRALSDVNGKLSDALKARDLDVLWNGTKWAVIGFLAGGALVGVIALATK
jgi:hypothetical protein